MKKKMPISALPKHGLQKYSARDLYNADETGIYYRTVPDGTLTFSTDKLSGSKRAKERVTAVVAVNMDGSDKRPLFIIGKSKEPRCFKGIPQLPTPYAHSSNAWMTGTIFRKWLVEFNKDMVKEDRHIALLVDNCSAHPKDSCENLSHVQLFFLPPNVTSIIQPCDMGIIRTLKALYRKNIISRIITHIDTGSQMSVSQLTKRISILDAMHMLKVAWQNVKQVSISNCFAKAGFVPLTAATEEEIYDSPDGMTLSEFQAYVDMDQSLDCHGELTDEDICISLQQENEIEEHESDGSDEPSAAPKPGDAVLAMQTVRCFMEKAGADLNQFYVLENQVLRLVPSACSQTSIRDFFSLSSPEYC